MTQPAPDNPHTSDRKLEREIEKLELEIGDLRRPLHRQPTVVFGALGALVAIGGLAISTVGAWRDAVKARRDAESAQSLAKSLDEQVKAAELALASALLDSAQARAAADQAEQRRSSAEHDVQELKVVQGRLAAQIGENQSQIDLQNNELNAVKVQLADARRSLAEIVANPDVPADTRKAAETARAAIDVPDLIACDIADGPFFVAVGQAGTVVMTSDNGVTWRREHVGQEQLVAVDTSRDGSTICIGGADGRVFVSGDRGGTFTERHRGPARWEAVGVAPDGRTIAAATGTRIARLMPGGSWNEAEISLRMLPTDALRLSDEAGFSLFGNAMPGTGSMADSAIVELLFASGEPPTERDVERRAGLATAVSTGGGLCVAAWDPLGRPEYRASLFRFDGRARDPWIKVAASHFPQVRSFWSSPDATSFIVISSDGKLLEADTVLARWTEHPARLPALNDVAGAPDGSTLWAVGKKETILHRSAEAPEWRLLRPGP